MITVSLRVGGNCEPLEKSRVSEAVLVYYVWSRALFGVLDDNPN